MVFADEWCSSVINSFLQVYCCSPLELCGDSSFIFVDFVASGILPSVLFLFDGVFNVLDGNTSGWFVWVF